MREKKDVHAFAVKRSVTECDYSSGVIYGEFHAPPKPLFCVVRASATVQGNDFHRYAT